MPVSFFSGQSLLFSVTADKFEVTLTNVHYRLQELSFLRKHPTLMFFCTPAIQCTQIFYIARKCSLFSIPGQALVGFQPCSAFLVQNTVDTSCFRSGYRQLHVCIGQIHQSIQATSGPPFLVYFHSISPHVLYSLQKNKNTDII